MVYKELQEVSDSIAKVKRMQDGVLDMYDPANQKMKELMVELVELEKEFNNLEQELEDLLASADY